MTDNEIIKALKCCTELDCSECLFRERTFTHCRKLKKFALDLINRQKAKIKHLKSVMRTMSEDGEE